MSRRFTSHAFRWVPSLAHYRAKHARLSAATDLPVRVDATTALVAYVNHGRYIADCPCKGGVVIHPDWPEAGCPDCGTWYTNVVMPDRATRLEAEAVLLERLPANRNWRPADEPVERLRFENQIYAHLLPGARERRGG